MDFSAPHISSCSLLIHVTCAVSSQGSFLDPFDHLHWSLFSNRQFTQVSNHTALFGMNKLPPTLHVPYQSGASSSPSSSSSSSESGQVVDISQRGFHSRLKTSLFPP